LNGPPCTNSGSIGLYNVEIRRAELIGLPELIPEAVWADECGFEGLFRYPLPAFLMVHSLDGALILIGVALGVGLCHFFKYLLRREVCFLVCIENRTLCHNFGWLLRACGNGGENRDYGDDSESCVPGGGLCLHDCYL